MRRYTIGLMSGTSLDGVDAVLLDCGAHEADRLRVVAEASAPFPSGLRQAFAALNHSGPDELHRAAQSGCELAEIYAQLVAQLLQSSGLKAHQIIAIGAHGQTVRHCPPATGVRHPYSLQINQPALLAERCGIAVVADFRNRDVAAGGQGAPLVPAFHQRIFGRAEQAVLVLNLGGIANLSALRPHADTLGFDTGPGNALLDLWCQRHSGAWFDRDGAWAASGREQPALLAHLLSDPYFAQSGHKSTGREHFSAAWLDQRLQPFQGLAPADVQATLTRLTARSVAQAVQGLDWGRAGLQQAWVCGGGSRNACLMQMLAEELPGVSVQPSEVAGWPAHWVEPAAFAWLALQALEGKTGNLPSVTGASGPRVLGAIYPA
ncbi:MAG: anhydro-N-acetylmuramic acid kinase [Serpentinimonas sp.]|nr:anhydro-N-acetylmuramic acid kinase [Serpentinimonas sp.]